MLLRTPELVWEIEKLQYLIFLVLQGYRHSWSFVCAVYYPLVYSVTVWRFALEFELIYNTKCVL